MSKGNSFRSMFFRDTEDTKQEQEQEQEQAHTTFGSKKSNNGGLLTPIKSIPTPVMVNSDSNLIGDFVEKMQELINQNNQSGFDFFFGKRKARE